MSSSAVAAHGDAGSSQPPEILGLLSDPVRWQLVVELGRSDCRVGELVALVGKPQNLVSYHLGELRRGRSRQRTPKLRRRPRHLLPGRSRSAAGIFSAKPVSRSIPGSRLPRLPQTTSSRDRLDRGCSSCALATVPAPRSPKRSSSTDRRAPSKHAARVAIPRRCIRTQCGSWRSGVSTLPIGRRSP